MSLITNGLILCTVGKEQHSAIRLAWTPVSVGRIHGIEGRAPQKYVCDDWPPYQREIRYGLLKIAQVCSLTIYRSITPDGSSLFALKKSVAEESYRYTGERSNQGEPSCCHGPKLPRLVDVWPWQVRQHAPAKL